jgi:probable HAF family extracellular repeat protein
MRKASLLAVVLMVASVALAQGTYTQIDYPGALGTKGVAIDTAGDNVGYYVDSSFNPHGFLLSNGSYTTIDYPGSLFTYLNGINDNGQIVGQSGDPNLGFLYDVQTQIFTEISSSGYLTYPLAINNGGQIAGVVVTPTGYRYFGFELAGSRYKIITPPNTLTSSVVGITASGELFGVATIAGHKTVDFSLSGGVYSEFSIPSKQGSQLTGVNPAGTAIVGFRLYDGGFIYRNKTLTTLLFPGSKFTWAYGINAAGEVVGGFENADFSGHGFTWVP